MKIKDAVSRFLRDHEDKPNTLRTYKSVLLNMARALGEERNIRNVSVMDVKDYAYEMRKKTPQGRVTSKTLSPTTIVHYENVIKLFFTWAVKCGLIKASPATSVKGGNRVFANAKERAFSEEDIEKLLVYAKWDKRLYALLLFLSHTGCRAAGAAGLKEQDINFDTGEAVVTEKGGKSRTVLFGPVANEAIRDWIESRSKKLKRTTKLSQPVFSTTGKTILPQAITKIVTRACENAGVKRMGAHAIRHYFGHMMAMRGVPASLTAVFMGHSNPTITLRVYYPNDLEKGRHLWEEYVGKPQTESESGELPDNVIKAKFK